MSEDEAGDAAETDVSTGDGGPSESADEPGGRAADSGSTDTSADGDSMDTSADGDLTDDSAAGDSGSSSNPSSTDQASDTPATRAALEDIESRMEGLQADVSGLDRELDRKITDVRERVIQVKRETDAKAPADHDHPDIEERLAAAAQTASQTKNRIDELAETVDALDARITEGFENYEDILEYLTEEVDDVAEKNTKLARAIVSLRETIQGISQREGRRMAADRLREQANEHGIRTADCDDCGATLEVALLTDARCPHCKSTFASVEPKRGFFGRPTLEVGDRPALESPDAPGANAADVADILTDGDGRVDTESETDTASRDAGAGSGDIP